MSRATPTITTRPASRPPAGGLLALALLPLLGGCQLGYVLRQGAGQLGIVWGARDVDRMLAEDGGALRDEQRRKLELVLEVRGFAREELGLDVGDAYTTYHDVGEPAISYGLSAAHPLALVPYRWSFPFVGEVTYKGFFDADDCREEAGRLREAGWDTHVARIDAFSTLGWFRDPVLSTMLMYDDGDLVDLIIHELVHRTVYFKGHTAANESMATAVARAGARLFLDRRFGEDSAERSAYEAAIDARSARDRLLGRLRADLDALYRSALSDDVKLARKLQLFDTASRALGHLSPGEAAPRLEPSNAAVLARGQYDIHVPLFEAALESFGGSPRRLMAFLRGLPASGDPVPVIAERLRQREKDRA